MSRRSLVFALFVLSGCAGLIYEVVWARQLVLVFGNTTQAISTILTGFFGGMAIGNAVGGRLGDRVRRPLLVYGLIEIVLVIVVLLTPVTFRLVKEVYRDSFATLQTTPGALSLVRFGLALLALAPATVLMGATLPMLTRYLSRFPGELSVVFGRLYAYNTLGGILGVMAAGFLFIELFGLWGTIQVGVACSGAAGLIAILLDRGSPVTAELPSRPVTIIPVAVPVIPRVHLAMGFAFVSGLTSLGYQVLWTRLLASGTGNSTYIFSTVLALFLVGLAFGALLYGDLRARITDAIGFLALGQIVVAALAVLGMATITWYPDAFQSVAQHDVGATKGFALLAMLVVLPPTIVMGLTFPAAASLIADARGRVATNSGMFLAANTVGSIVATFLIPFALIPRVGSPSAVGLLVLLNAAAGIILGFVKPLSPSDGGHRVFRLTAVFSGAVTGIVVLLAAATSRVFVDPNSRFILSNGGTIEASAEDEIASVISGGFLGAKQLWVTGNSMTALTVDAKLMGILPLMLRPESTKSLIIAFGMGTAYRASLIAGLQTTAVEIVPSVPLMFPTFYGDAASVLSNANGKLIIADGRNYIELTDDKYDMIVVDPPPPAMTAGVSVIACREFYVAAKRRLNRGGVMMQFVPGGQTLAEFKAHVRTFRVVFPNVVVAQGPGGNGFFMLGSDQRLTFDPLNIRSVLERPALLQDISSAFDAPERTVDGWAKLIPRLVSLSGAQVAKFAGAGPLITDDKPLPEYFMLRHAFGTPSPRLAADLVVP